MAYGEQRVLPQQDPTVELIRKKAKARRIRATVAFVLFIGAAAGLATLGGPSDSHRSDCLTVASVLTTLDVGLKVLNNESKLLNDPSTAFQADVTVLESDYAKLAASSNTAMAQVTDPKIKAALGNLAADAAQAGSSLRSAGSKDVAMLQSASTDKITADDDAVSRLCGLSP
jgi:hypothetical protein